MYQVVCLMLPSALCGTTPVDSERNRSQHHFRLFLGGRDPDQFWREAGLVVGGGRRRRFLHCATAFESSGGVPFRPLFLAYVPGYPSRATPTRPGGSDKTCSVFFVVRVSV